MRISLCMIVKDEEQVLDRCLSNAILFADEIVVVDTGSKDATKAIAQKYTKNIYDFNWEDDFSKARNFAFSKATNDYLMWIDADDVIDRENIKKIIELKEKLSAHTDIVMMKYNVAFDDAGIPVFSFYRERLFKNDGTHFFEGEIHETVPLVGRIEYSNIEINHKKEKVNEPERNLRIFRKMIAQGKRLSPREQYYYARELYYNNFYFTAVAQFNLFLKENKGCISDNIQACLMAGDCYLKLSDDEKALQLFFKSFSYDVPSGEACCKIGDYFFQLKKYNLAIFWYETALKCKKNIVNGFFQKDYYDFIPFIQLCLCYERIGNIEKSKEYNELAGKIKPYDKSYQYNKEYFEKL